jgi:hypothetical protein
MVVASPYILAVFFVTAVGILLSMMDDHLGAYLGKVFVSLEVSVETNGGYDECCLSIGGNGTTVTSSYF